MFFIFANNLPNEGYLYIILYICYYLKGCDTMKNPHILELKDLDMVFFKEKHILHVLDKINLTVDSGQIVGL